VSYTYAITHSPLLLDACCVLNFCASGQLLSIIESIPVQVAVTKVVQERELKTLQRLEEGETEGILQFETAIAQSLLTIVDFELEAEVESFVNYAAILGDDGESATCAIAFHRGWVVATDDRGAMRFIRRELPHLEIISTLEIVKHWADKKCPEPSKLQDVLQKIKVKARYSPDRNHPLQGWWEAAFK